MNSRPYLRPQCQLRSKTRTQKTRRPTKRIKRPTRRRKRIRSRKPERGWIAFAGDAKSDVLFIVDGSEFGRIVVVEERHQVEVVFVRWRWFGVGAGRNVL